MIMVNVISSNKYWLLIARKLTDDDEIPLLEFFFLPDRWNTIDIVPIIA